MNSHGVRFSTELHVLFPARPINIIEKPSGKIPGQISVGRRLQRFDFGHGLEEPDRVIDNRNSSHVALAEGIIQPDKVIRPFQGKINQPLDLLGGEPQEIRLWFRISPVTIVADKFIHSFKRVEIPAADKFFDLFVEGAGGILLAPGEVQPEAAIDIPLSRFARAGRIFVFVHLLFPIRPG
jgi:hypothetical protein